MDTIESLQKRINANRRLLRNRPNSPLLELVIEEDTIALNALCQKEADDMSRCMADRVRYFADGYPSRKDIADEWLARLCSEKV